MNFLEVFYSLDVYGKNNLIKSIIEKIHFYRLKGESTGHLKIHFRF